MKLKFVEIRSNKNNGMKFIFKDLEGCVFFIPQTRIIGMNEEENIVDIDEDWCNRLGLSDYALENQKVIEDD